MKGFLLVDKEKGWTSFDVVAKIRGVLSRGVAKQGKRKRLKVGHAGTLDPLATGLLFIAVGDYTKLLKNFVGLDKEYEVEAEFGFTSDTYDAEGNLQKVDVSFEAGITDIEKIIKDKFVGEIEQIPPKYSALKINGKKAYELARSGKEFEVKSRKVVIKQFDIIDFNWPIVKFRIFCGSGTYVRSLIHDLGQELGCGAYVKGLRRTKVGDFSVEKALRFSDCEDAFEEISEKLFSP